MNIKTRGSRAPMVQQFCGSLDPAEVEVDAEPPILADTIAKVSVFNGYLTVASKPAALKEQGIASNQKAASASLLLRLGWGGGFAIGAYPACRRVPTLSACAVSFSPPLLLQSVWIWAEQFTSVVRRIGDESVQGGRNARRCQRRSARRLCFKNSARHFSASPIIAEYERLERNRVWVASEPGWRQRSF